MALCTWRGLARAPRPCPQVSVATNFDAPIKLLFPRALDAAAKAAGKRPYAMLGLGDIVSAGVKLGILWCGWLEVW